MKSLKAIGFMLSYPEGDFCSVLPEFGTILAREKWLPPAAVEAIARFMDWAAGQDLLDLQEGYVDLFDRTPSLSLHLFEHIHGDSRDRGQAMVDLVKLYEEEGMVIHADEMPDFLPLFLEYLSELDAERAAEHLGSVVDILSAIGKRLENRKSPYAALFTGLIDAAARKPDPAALAAALKQAQGAAHDLETLDREWVEQFAFENTPQTTGQAGHCPKAQDILDQMERNSGKEGVRQ